ncbi:MAG: type II toxin-antitoxin system ParD family antitoxin [Bacteroidales bacterium]|nr:type II toxin-antitoxin system ParD family antitoxin [Bacteroidales bacterium]
MAALRAAIEDGENSGYVENFDFKKNLEDLRASRRKDGTV